MKQTEERIRARIKAREDAGLTLEQAAKQAGICLAYLKRIERQGCPSPITALVLARIYKARVDIFL